MNELLTPAQCYEADKLSVQYGIALETLIDNAGRKVAEEIARRYQPVETIALCGPGNNGQDGRRAAQYLERWGWPVHIATPEDFDPSGAGLIIDAAYGAGLSRDFPTALADKIAGSGAVIVAVDVPSGLDGETGRPRGACARADLTISFFRKKPAHLLEPGRSLCGELVMADIGISSQLLEVIRPRLWENQPPTFKPLSAETHKYRRGSALIMSGPKLATGASRLSATAALMIGSGLVTLCGDEPALTIQAAHCTAIMLALTETVPELEKKLSDERLSALCIGPGAGVSDLTEQHVTAFLKAAKPTVLDADALTCFAKNPPKLFDLIQQIPTREVVLTPHEGEFARLFPDLAASILPKHEKARSAAKRSGAIIVLKGPDTVIAHPDGRAKINSNAPPSLATAGSGDVLSGLITGLLAQGLPGFEAAAGAVWIHGDLANRHGPQGLTAEGLISTLSDNR